MKDTILAIAGKPGLYRMITRGNNSVIVETVDAQKKRTAIGMRDRITSLGDIAMYTDEEDVPLTQVFQNLYDALQGPSPLSHKTASAAQLEEFMTTALPAWDRDRVRQSDIKKLLQWYNVLANAGYTEFHEKEETTTEA
ncbi:MAG: DUF5606 domain-containing protein [Bacteroidaceae bacterium]|nr:DUF5606 domain-containing protein [Candidatus Equimonas faecalis]MCQ2206116.1 DUF5606 domain-containing protein [Bacteroidaceae bacterium]